jgi:N-acetylmuramoyl-L-alanine amidase
MRDIDHIVIHCTATKEGVDYSVEQVRDWHVNGRGFRDIGYHFFIRLDGTIDKGRPIEQAGAHAKGYNKHSIGVVYVGGLDSYGKPKDTRTVAQFHALRRCVETLKVIYGDVEVVGHRDLSVDLNGDGMISANEWMKACPCFDVKTEL